MENTTQTGNDRVLSSGYWIYTVANPEGDWLPTLESVIQAKRAEPKTEFFVVEVATGKEINVR